MPGALPADHDDDTCGNAGGRAADHRRSELRRPLGMTIAGGLIVSQVLTLYTTPVIDLMLDRLRHRLGGGRAVQTLRDTLHERTIFLPAAQCGERCQKQPCTNTTARCPGRTIRRPGRWLECSVLRNPFA
jgi:hypothetical protein